MALNDFNKRIILGVKASILAEPKMYDQREFADKENPCGTACCLAGWAVQVNSLPEFLEASQNDHFHWAERASELMGVPANSGLFGTGICWPHPFADRLWDECKTAQERANCAADLLDAIIAADGIENVSGYVNA